MKKQPTTSEYGITFHEAMHGTRFSKKKQQVASDIMSKVCLKFGLRVECWDVDKGVKTLTACFKEPISEDVQKELMIFLEGELS